MILGRVLAVGGTAFLAATALVACTAEPTAQLSDTPTLARPTPVTTSPELGPAETFSPTPEVDLAIPDGTVVTWNGIGPLQIGLNLPGAGLAVDYCGTVPPLPENVRAWESADHQVTGISIGPAVEEWEVDYVTDTGIGIGSSREDIEAAYGGAVVWEDRVATDDEDPDGRTYWEKRAVVASPDGQTSMVFTFDSGFEEDFDIDARAVSAFRVVTPERLDTVNHCS